MAIIPAGYDTTDLIHISTGIRTNPEDFHNRYFAEKMEVS